MIDALVLDSALVARISREARAAFPAECCGLLEGFVSGRDGSERPQVTAVHPTRNLAAEPAGRFEIDPAEHFRILRDARAHGREVVGCYHSHPNGRPEPSPCDAENGSTDGFVWLVAAVRETSGELGAFVFENGAFRPIALESAPSAAGA